MKTRYTVKWFDGFMWVGGYCGLTLKQATKVAKEMTEKNGLATKVTEYK